ncbi:MAG: hypothetical protein RIG82_04720 [Phycisphaeraceae bacterium]
MPKAKRKPSASTDPKLLRMTREQARSSALRLWSISLFIAGFTIAAIAVLNRMSFPRQFSTQTALTTAFLLLVFSAPIGAMARMQTYKRHWVGQAVTPAGYLAGTRVYLTTILVAILLAGVLLALAPINTLIIVVFALASLGSFAIAYPQGEPMTTRIPDLEYSRTRRKR